MARLVACLSKWKHVLLDVLLARHNWYCALECPSMHNVPLYHPPGQSVEPSHTARAGRKTMAPAVTMCAIAIIQNPPTGLVACVVALPFLSNWEIDVTTIYYCTHCCPLPSSVSHSNQRVKVLPTAETKQLTRVLSCHKASALPASDWAASVTDYGSHESHSRTP
jgi:hypothetical protein